MKKNQSFDASDIWRTLSEQIKQQATRPNIHAYMPHHKQELFHSSTKKRRLYIGGNRSGKTTGGVVEDIWWARGQHPYRRLPEGPIRGRVVGVDFLNGIQKIILPEFSRWCPPSLLKNGSWEDSYNKELRTLNFANDSFIEFMSYDQDTDKFAGTSRHFVHYDEEPPLHVFNECNARLVDTKGSWWLTMTPVEGMSWIYDTIYVPGTEDPNSGIDVIEVDMQENPHLDPEAIEDFLSSLSKEEREAREKGKFVQLGGRVYKDFSEEFHTIEPIIPPKDWQWFVSMDHGFNNPTAFLWHAVSPTNEVITFAEHYASEMTVAEHAAVVHSRNANFNRIPDVYVGDPAIAQRSGITGTSIQTEYMENDIPIMPGNNDVAVGVARVSQYLKPIPGSSPQRPRWRITKNCTNLIWEMKRLRWATYSSRKLQMENNKKDAIHKKDDHACDSARYFFTFMPDLTPSEVLGPDLISPPSNTNVETYDQALVKMTQQTPQWKIQQGSDIYSLEYDY